MVHHLLNSIQRASGLKHHRSTTSTPAPGAELSDARIMQTILDQIEDSLQQLNDVTGSTLATHGEVAPATATQLQPVARQAEVAMHRLRHLGWARSSAATELSQSLTVVVLLTDLLASGQLVGAGVLDSYDLLSRNIARATNCIAKLRAPV